MPEIWCCYGSLRKGNGDCKIIWKHVMRGTENVSPEDEKTQIKYKRDVYSLWSQEAEPGSEMLLHESWFQPKGATFGGRVPFYFCYRS